MSPADCDVAVLAGGLGTRLRGTIGALPKVLAPVAGRPFLDILLDQIARQGFRRVVLLLGYRADAVEAHLAQARRTDLAIETVIETAPLGTAGALRGALPRLASDPVVVMNGDTFVEFDAAAVLAALGASDAAAALVAVRVPDAGRYGALALDGAGRVARFLEKRPDAGPGLINGGVYAFGRAFLDAVMASDGPSLERDVLERLPAGALLAVETAGRFIDIGTPESLAQAPSIVGG
jgi:NDP-sugar pyrophosphorylase family protein